MVTRRSVIAASAAPFTRGAAAAAACADDDPIERDLAVLDAQAHLRSGSEGDLAISAHVRATLAQAGFRVRRQSLTCPWFEPSRAALTWPGGETAVLPQAIVRPTGANGLRAPMHLWRDPSDTAGVAGAIVLAILPHSRHSRLMAPATRQMLHAISDAAAAAIVLITDGPTGETIQLNAPFAPDPSLPPLAVLGPVPGAAAIAAAGGGAEGRLVLDGAIGQRRSHNIWGTVERTGPYLVVSTPRTAWTPAVGERGPGLAAFNALAQWSPAAFPQHSVMFISTTAHEYDNAGSLAFFEQYAPPPDRVALWVHLGAGFATRDFHEIGDYRLAPLPSPDAQRFLVANESLLPILSETFAGLPGLEEPYPASAGAEGELAEILSRGYANVCGLFGAHRFHHVMQDRRDKVEARWVRSVVDALKTSISSTLGAF